MNRIKKIAISLLMLCLIVCQSLTVFASSGVSSGDGLKTLIRAVACEKSGASTGDIIGYGGEDWDYSGKTYKCSDGGYKLYGELAVNNIQKPIDENNLKLLTIGAKNEFLTDYYNAGQALLNWSKQNNYTYGLTEEVGTNWLERVQNTSGVGSQLMTTLMSQTKPDFISANRIYKPFSGTVGTILGVISVVLMALLSLTMVADLAYIGIPTIQMFVDGGGDGNGQGGGKKKSFISTEARNAVQAAEGGQGGGGQSGESKKLAISIYFKNRVAMLVVFCICLLYLVSGNIFSFIGWFIDLFSGFLGF